MDVVLARRTLTAQEAEAAGLVARVTEADAWLDEALRIACEIASRSPIAIALAKKAVAGAFELTLEDGLAFERELVYARTRIARRARGDQKAVDRPSK